MQKVKKFKHKTDYYSPSEISKKFKISNQTVYTRFRSKHRLKRWGVERFLMPDGTIKEFVHKDNLKLWKHGVGLYLGAPKKE